MDDQILHALHQRIDEHHAYLSDRLDALQATMEAFYEALAERLEAHEAYHRANEHRFGLLRLAERHPLRLAAATFLGGGLLLATAPESLRWMTAAAGYWLRQLFP
jgi:hypothetical protein